MLSVSFWFSFAIDCVRKHVYQKITVSSFASHHQDFVAQTGNESLHKVLPLTMTMQVASIPLSLVPINKSVADFL